MPPTMRCCRARSELQRVNNCKCVTYLPGMQYVMKPAIPRSAIDPHRTPVKQIGCRYRNNHNGMSQSNFILQSTYMKPSHPVPTVSIITPTKNRLRLLTEAIDSVVAQTYGNWEHLIVDDGSDDGTESFVRMRAASDSRVRFIKREGAKSDASYRELHARREWLNGCLSC